MTNKLIIIADAGKARFFKALGFKIKSEQSTLDANELVVAHDKQPLRQGFYHKASTSSHFFDPHSEAKDLERSDFAKKIIQQAHHLYHQAHYDGLIIVAEPKMLGTIRSNLNKELATIVVKEIHKDLTHLTMEEIEQHVFYKD